MILHGTILGVVQKDSEEFYARLRLDSGNCNHVFKILDKEILIPIDAYTFHHLPLSKCTANFTLNYE